MPDIDGVRGMEDNFKKSNAEILEKIIFHLSEAFKLFNDLKNGRVSEIEQREWKHSVKLCKDAIGFINGKLMALERLPDDPGP